MLETWPELPYAAWQETAETLHLWTQIVGKVKLALCPFLNQWWEVTFHLTAHGLNTGLIPWNGESFDIDFNFISHHLSIRVSDGRRMTLPLRPQTVADFYQQFMAALDALGITVAITPIPAEMPSDIHFDQDTTHAAYDADSVQRWWRVMLAVSRAIERFRTPFHGKSSPVQFFWGGFDLNATRFNGKSVIPPPTGGRIMEYGEDEENFAVGFWPGTAQFPQAAIYAYMSPAPPNIATAHIVPDIAQFNATLGEFVLLYDDARQVPTPEETIVSFFQSTYEECARLAGWDRQSLEGHTLDLPTPSEKLA